MKARPTSTHELKRKELRLQAAALFEQNLSKSEIARRLGCSREAVSGWYQRWRSEGIAGLSEEKRKGPAPRVSEEQWNRIVERLLEGPKAQGYTASLWTLGRIAALIEKETGVRYHPGYVWELMHAIDWTCQKPERRAKERNEEAIAGWITERWPQIKRGRESGGPS
jgi:transposase